MDILIIILSILKIIGLILLYALIFTILLIIILLFIPVKYSIYGEKKENNDTIARVKVSYLFRLLSCNYNYDNKKSNFIIKLLGFTIVGNKKKIKENKLKEVKNEKKPEKNKVYKDEVNKEQETYEKAEPYESDQIEKGKIKKLIDNINSIIEKIKLVYNYPDRKEIKELTVKLAISLYNIFKPKYLTLEGEVGFKSPDTTGYFMAAVSTLTFTDLDIRLKGNFHKEIFVAVLDAKGKFRICSILWLLSRYIFQKPIRTLIKQFI